MLTEPAREWTVQEIALLRDPQSNPLAEVKVSLGLAAAVKRKLLDFEYVIERNRRLVLTKPGELLDEWSKNYSLERSQRIGLYASYTAPSALENELAKRFPIRKGSPNARAARYAFTSFSGARVSRPSFDITQ